MRETILDLFRPATMASLPLFPSLRFFSMNVKIGSFAGLCSNHIRKVPSVAVGCMRLSEKSKDEMNHFIHAALEQGAYFFDHADIYGGGMSESVFGEAIADDPSIK